MFEAMLRRPRRKKTLHDGAIFLITPLVETRVSAPLILVAEDNEDNRIIAVTILRHVGYRVIEATTGADAVQLARSLQPALILMDVGMPDIDGWTATRTLKAHDCTKSIIILAFTAHTLPGDRQYALEAGCDGYLAKPIAPLRLVREVALALGEPTTHTS